MIHYLIERHEHGWLIVGPPDGGIPLELIQEATAGMPKGAVVAASVSHHYREAQQRNAIMAVAKLPDVARWEEAITASLANYSPEEQWWLGCDVGRSSAAIFAVLCENSQLRARAHRMADGSVPHDADDLGRCQRLVERFGWADRLPEVAAAYPNGLWPKVVAAWPALMATSFKERSAALAAL